MILVAFDVDGTLIDEDDEPRSDIVTMLFLLDKYCKIMVWSGSGVEYARMWGARLCLPDDVMYASKTENIVPDVAFDDVQTFSKGLAIIRV